jgi:crossover junction endodeoxyribonuclease RuvC
MGPFPLASGDLILGLDPGLEATGWAVCAHTGCGLEAIKFGCEHTLPSQSMPERIDQQARLIESLIVTYHPVVIVPEAWVFYGGKGKGAGGNTMRVAGAVRGLAVAHRIPCVEYTAQAVKGIAMGNRMAEKLEVQKAMQSAFGLPKLPRPNHAADALACCRAHWLARCAPGEVMHTSKGVVP